MSVCRQAPLDNSNPRLTEGKLECGRAVRRLYTPPRRNIYRHVLALAPRLNDANSQAVNSKPNSTTSRSKDTSADSERVVQSVDDELLIADDDDRRRRRLEHSSMCRYCTMVNGHSYSWYLTRWCGLRPTMQVIINQVTVTIYKRRRGPHVHTYRCRSLEIQHAAAIQCSLHESTRLY